MVFLFQHILKPFPNDLSQVSQKQWVQTAQSKEWFNSMRCVHTLQSSYSQRFCPVFIRRHFFLTTSLQAPLNILSQILQRQSFQTVQHSVNLNFLKWMHTSERCFLKSFCLGFISGYFTFRHSLQRAAKCHFFSFTTTVFKHCLMRKEV